MPPSKRFGPISQRPGGNKDEDDKQAVEKLSEKTAKKLAKGTIAIEYGQIYDMSLWKAIYHTVWKKWWIAVILNGLGSEYGQDC